MAPSEGGQTCGGAELRPSGCCRGAGTLRRARRPEPATLSAAVPRSLRGVSTGSSGWLPGSLLWARGAFTSGRVDASGQQPRRNFAVVAWAAVSPGVGSPSCFRDFLVLKQWESFCACDPSSPLQTGQPHHGHGLGLYPGPALPWEKRLIWLPSRDIDEWRQS